MKKIEVYDLDADELQNLADEHETTVAEIVDLALTYLQANKYDVFEEEE